MNSSSNIFTGLTLLDAVVSHLVAGVNEGRVAAGEDVGHHPEAPGLHCLCHTRSSLLLPMEASTTSRAMNLALQLTSLGWNMVPELRSKSQSFTWAALEHVD